jgi:hypothetical protein
MGVPHGGSLKERQLGQKLDGAFPRGGAVGRKKPRGREDSPTSKTDTASAGTETCTHRTGPIDRRARDLSSAKMIERAVHARSPN